MPLKSSHLLIAAVSTLFVCGVYYLLDHTLDGSFWDGMTLSQTVARREYCEYSDMDDLLRQCVNSYSNLAFFFFGMILLLTGMRDRKHPEHSNPIKAFPGISILAGISLVYLCFGSTFFHASLTWPGQRVDMNATYSVCIIMVLMSLYRLCYPAANEERLRKSIVIGFLVLVPVYVYLHLLIPSIYLLPFMMLCVITLTAWNISRQRGLQHHRYALLSLACLIGAAVFRQLDTAKIGCNPMSIWQGHAAWHVMIGGSPFFLYLFYRSEEMNA